MLNHRVSLWAPGANTAETYCGLATDSQAEMGPLTPNPVWRAGKWVCWQQVTGSTSLPTTGTDDLGFVVVPSEASLLSQLYPSC